MAVSLYTTPLAILLELLIFGMGIYAGYYLKKTCGYLFGCTFFIFAIFDFLGAMSVSTDILSSLNILAILMGIAGMYVLIKEVHTT